MDLKDRKVIRERVGLLVGQPMRYAKRAADMATFGLGEMVEQVIEVRKHGELTGEIQRRMVARYKLHLQCMFRWTYKSRIIAARNDIYEPSEAIQREVGYNGPEFDYDAFWDEFDYDVQGKNLYDEFNLLRIKPLIANTDNFVVEKVEVNQFGDLKLKFENGFTLSAMADTSEEVEQWRFFGQEDEHHLVVCANGQEEYED